MDFSLDSMPDAATSYSIFFIVSISILGVILLTNLPSFFRAIRHQVKLAIARRNRGPRMLANDKQLQQDARNLEGVYYFHEDDDSIPEWAEFFDGDVYEEVASGERSQAA